LDVQVVGLEMEGLICEFADCWVADLRICGFADCWVADLRICWVADCWVADCWVANLRICWVADGIIPNFLLLLTFRKFILFGGKDEKNDRRRILFGMSAGFPCSPLLLPRCASLNGCKSSEQENLHFSIITISVPLRNVGLPKHWRHTLEGPG